MHRAFRHSAVLPLGFYKVTEAAPYAHVTALWYYVSSTLDCHKCISRVPRFIMICISPTFSTSFSDYEPVCGYRGWKPSLFTYTLYCVRDVGLVLVLVYNICNCFTAHNVACSLPSLESASVSTASEYSHTAMLSAPPLVPQKVGIPLASSSLGVPSVSIGARVPYGATSFTFTVWRDIKCLQLS